MMPMKRKKVKPPPSSPTEKEILSGALDLLTDEDNWGRGAYYGRQSGRFCMIGACYFVASGRNIVQMLSNTVDMNFQSPGMEGARSRLRACVRKLKPRSTAVELEGFNDSRRTTHKDVVTVLKCAVSSCA